MKRSYRKLVELVNLSYQLLFNKVNIVIVPSSMLTDHVIKKYFCCGDSSLFPDVIFKKDSVGIVVAVDSGKIVLMDKGRHVVML